MQENKKQTNKTDDKIVKLVVAEGKKEDVKVPVELEVVSEQPVKKEAATKKTTKPATKKAPAKTKVPAKPKAATEKGASTRSTLKTSIFIQHDGKEIEEKDIIARIKEIWVSQLGNKVSEMKTLTTYIKPEENSIYYVINEEVTGRMDF